MPGLPGQPSGTRAARKGPIDVAHAAEALEPPGLGSKTGSVPNSLGTIRLAGPATPLAVGVGALATVGRDRGDLATGVPWAKGAEPGTYGRLVGKVRPSK